MKARAICHLLSPHATPRTFYEYTLRVKILVAVFVPTTSRPRTDKIIPRKSERNFLPVQHHVLFRTRNSPSHHPPIVFAADDLGKTSVSGERANGQMQNCIGFPFTEF
ncbi:hypothetical protein TNCV_1589601 [Trichonephila clavipes]|uniref:Uncharacterized protein n=1 Tax=Trichonephila clavipes TaxID=2585209 RepID=A0A8X6RJM8_TRICX|nr:hypothetical protein TNCV_1589601 [Trichonephila clavipes]